MAYNKYTPEFKQEAIALVRDRGLTLTQAATDLRISQTTLQR